MYVARSRNTCSPLALFEHHADSVPRNQNGVLDSNLQVYGTQGLRVIDASSFPELPPGHPQSTVCSTLSLIESSSGAPPTSVLAYITTYAFGPLARSSQIYMIAEKGADLIKAANK